MKRKRFHTASHVQDIVMLAEFWAPVDILGSKNTTKATINSVYLPSHLVLIDANKTSGWRKSKMSLLYRIFYIYCLEFVANTYLASLDNGFQMVYACEYQLVCVCVCVCELTYVCVSVCLCVCLCVCAR